MEKNNSSQNIKSLYLHFPYCRHLCNYCDFFKSKIDPKTIDFTKYHNDLLESFEKQSELLRELGRNIGELETLYIGGGTPSLWGKRGAEFLKEFFEKNDLSLALDGEFTLEVNPGSWTEESLSSWIAFGINRFSLGIQSFDSNYIKYLDRVHDLKDVVETLEYFQTLNIDFSVDFMLGLPFSEQGRDIEKELEEILKFSPDHISLYILTVNQGYKHYSELPDDEFISNEYLKVNQILKKNGFDQYEVSNYSIPGRESRHNFKYWEQKSVAALGPSATGFINLGNKYGVRYKWKTSENTFVLEEINSEMFMTEKLFLNLRTSKGIRIDEIFSSKEVGKLKSVFNRWDEKGLANFNGNFLTLNSSGFLIQDTLIDEIYTVITGT